MKSDELKPLDIKEPDPLETNLVLNEIYTFYKDQPECERWVDAILSAIYFIEGYVPSEKWLKSESEVPFTLQQLRDWAEEYDL